MTNTFEFPTFAIGDMVMLPNENDPRHFVIGVNGDTYTLVGSGGKVASWPVNWLLPAQYAAPAGMFDLYVRLSGYAAESAAMRRTFTRDQAFEIVARDGNVCAHEDADCSGNLQVDHIVPFSHGGETEVENGQLLCAHHNASKGNRFVG